MKAGYRLFAGLAVFYFIMTVIYWQVGGEAVGITAIMLSGGLAALIGFYIWFTNKRLGGNRRKASRSESFRGAR